MVCSRCQKLSTPTSLATPEVKKKNEMYYGSPAGSSSRAGTSKTSATLGQTGIGKAYIYLVPYSIIMANIYLQSKLLSKSAKNPYAAYSSSCGNCPTKLEAGRKYCQKCAYQKNGNARMISSLYSNADVLLQHVPFVAKRTRRRQLLLRKSTDRNTPSNRGLNT